MPRNRRRRGNTSSLPQVPPEILEQFQAAWARYDSIDLLKKQETIDEIRENGHTAPDVEWVITEKIHGANFGLITDGRHVLASKRSSILQPGQQFFRGWERVAATLYKRVRKIFHHIKENFQPDATVITVFGELFGGYYEHPDIEVDVEEVGQVQFGLSYSPRLHFCAFDIRVDDVFLDYDVALQISRHFSLMFAEPIGRGPFDECIDFDVETFETRVPELLKLPPPVTRHGEPNIGEGVVIRLATGGHVMIKKKAQKFWEFSRKGGVEESRTRRDMEFLVGKLCCDFMFSCLTNSRFDGAVSKIGSITEDNVASIVREFAEDVMKDVILAFPALRKMAKSDLDRFRTFANQKAHKFATGAAKRRRRAMRQEMEERKDD